jgi:hypothetical protein
MTVLTSLPVLRQIKPLLARLSRLLRASAASRRRRSYYRRFRGLAVR